MKLVLNNSRTLKSLLLAAILLLGGISSAQEKITVREMMKNLESEHDINFVYDSGLNLNVPSAGTRAEQGDIDKELESIFMYSGIDWKRDGKYVVLTQRKSITISGHITDAQSGETLIAAGVLSDAGRNYGAVSNNFGYYSLTIPGKATAEGRPVTIQYSYVGYESQLVTLQTPHSATINIALKPSASIKEALVVSRKDAGIQSTNISAIEVPLKQVKNTPLLLGEADVLKVIQMMPGVQGGMEGLSGMHVRGGGPDENLVLLDGIPIYNINHMLGLFSVFQPEAVKKVTLYKGAFPARFGGRASSVLDIRTNDGNMKETKGMFSVGMLSDKFHLEGPIIEDKLSYSVSARGLHTIFFDTIIRLALKGSYYNYFYYDLNGKLTWRIDDKDRLYFGIYSGADRLKGIYNETGASNWADYLSDIGIRYGNNVASVRWNHIFSKQLFSNTTVAFNRYSMKAGSKVSETFSANNGLNEYDSEYKSGIRDYSVKTDFDYNPSPSHLIRFGTEYLFHTFTPESMIFSENTIQGDGFRTDTTYKVFDSKKYHGHELSVYAEDDIRLGDKVRIDAEFKGLSAYSEVVVPEPVGLELIDTLKSSSQGIDRIEENIYANLRIKDIEGEDSYFRVGNMRHHLYQTYRLAPDQDGSQRPDEINEQWKVKSYVYIGRDPILHDDYLVNEDDDILSSLNPTNHFKIFSDKLFKDDAAKVQVNFDESTLDKYIRIVSPPEDIENTESISTAYLVIEHIRPETYRFYKAMNAARTFSYESYGGIIMEPVVIPSNVIGGVGFVDVSMDTTVAVPIGHFIMDEDDYTTLRPIGQ